MKFIEDSFEKDILQDKASVLIFYKTLYMIGFGMLIFSFLFFILSSIRSIQIPFLIIGVMVQINSLLFFLFAGILKLSWEIKNRDNTQPEETTPPVVDDK